MTDAASKSSPNAETLTGYVERILFSSGENGYTVAVFQCNAEARAVTICGNLPAIQVGENLKLSGKWIVHDRYGRQFQAETFQRELPSTSQGIERYLSSGLIDGIGPVYAKRIVAKFGADTLHILAQNPERLAEIKGIGQQRIEAIRKTWKEQQTLQEILVALQSYSIPMGTSLQIYKHFGDKALNIIKRDPYRLAREIAGIGFKTADGIALNLGWDRQSPERLESGLIFVLEQIQESGNSCYPEELLLDRGREILQAEMNSLQIVLQQLLDSQRIRRIYRQDLNVPLIQSETFFQLERNIENHLARIQRGKSQLPAIRIEEAITWAQEREGFPFATQQTEALRHGLMGKISILTGGPGTGKTTILRALTAILKTKRCHIELAAPTGRAAQKMAEATGIGAKTIHRLLGYNPIQGQFSHSEYEPLPVDYVIVDESSMLDEFLAEALLKAIPSKSHLLLVGDSDQLPSVGPGNFLADLIRSQQFRVTRLERIFRQDDGSNIPSIAHSIISGNPLLPPQISDYQRDDFSLDIGFIPSNSPEECVAIIENLICRVLPEKISANSIEDIQLLVPMHRGIAGIHHFNEVLQRQLVKNFNNGPTFKFQRGDKVIQLRNNYDRNIYNGDFGRVISIDDANKKLLVKFDSALVELPREEWVNLMLAYAISVHKSQGSEFPIVILPILNQHFILLKRNLLYTAITRGRAKVILVGDKKAYFTAAKSVSSDQRFSNLLFE